MAIVDKATAMGFLKITSLNPDEGIILDALVDEISAAVEDYCGRKFESATFTQDYNGSGTRNLMLQQFPIVSVTTVTRTKADAANTEVTVVKTEYNVHKDAGILQMHPVNYSDSAVWLKGDMNYEIVYVAGYASGSMPKAIIGACKIWIAVIFEKAKHNLFAVQSTTLGEETINFSTEAIPPPVKLMLKNWRKLA